MTFSLLTGNLQVKIAGVTSVRKSVAVVHPPTIFNSPIYFGGIKKNSAAEKFLKENEMDYILGSHFYGCMQQLTINYKRISADSVFDSLNVNLDTCPPLRGKKRDNSTCNMSTTEIVYNGTNTSTIDERLQPFSGKLYFFFFFIKHIIFSNIYLKNTYIKLKLLMRKVALKLNGLEVEQKNGVCTKFSCVIYILLII